jgi:hypothetical protein
MRRASCFVNLLRAYEFRKMRTPTAEDGETAGVALRGCATLRAPG